jgi:23S rRNA A2030 N6-methylase RlmJ
MSCPTVTIPKSIPALHPKILADFSRRRVLSITEEATMTYNHAKKAGNRGDVWKQAILTLLADQVDIAGETFVWLETHAGAPIHHLEPRGEWEKGIGAALQRGLAERSAYAQRATDFVRQHSYPAGWRFAAERLASRTNNVLIKACDTSDAVAKSYQTLEVLRGIRCTFQQVDGYEALMTEDADFVFMDPPFSIDSRNDWRKMIDAAESLRERQVPFAIWYPCTRSGYPDDLVRQTSCTSVEVWWDTWEGSQSQTMRGCGMLISPELLPIVEAASNDLKAIADSLRAFEWGTRRAPVQA